jgi:hypothetical protein
MTSVESDAPSKSHPSSWVGMAADALAWHDTQSESAISLLSEAFFTSPL